MKTSIIILVLLIVTILAGFGSYRFFRLSDYNFSALLTYASYFSIVMGIYALSNHRPSKKIAG
jgi:hypothetical protein